MKRAPEPGQILYGNIFKTAWGWALLTATGRGLFSFSFPGKMDDLDAEIAAHGILVHEGVNKDSAMDAGCGVLTLLDAGSAALERYFAGKPTTFDFPVDATGFTEFQLLIYRTLRQVPWGEVVSYGQLALQAGVPGGARAVGGAMGRNPLPVLIPCHRVVASGGKLGGFTGGLEIKRKLLFLEGRPEKELQD